MASIGDVPAPSSTINFPRIESTDPSRDGSRQCELSRYRNRMSCRQSCVVPLKIFDHSPHDGRDRPPCHRKIHVVDCLIDELSDDRKAFQETMRSRMTSPASFVSFGKQCEAVLVTLLPASEEPTQSSNRTGLSCFCEFVRSRLELISGGLSAELSQWLNGLPAVFKLFPFIIGEIMNGRRQGGLWLL